MPSSTQNAYYWDQSKLHICIIVFNPLNVSVRMHLNFNGKPYFKERESQRKAKFKRTCNVETDASSLYQGF